MARDGSSREGDTKVGWQIPWDQSFLVALDKNTGKVRWKTGRGLSRIAHVTPCLWRNESGRTQVISGAGDVVQGFDALTGERLWTSENIGEGVVPSVVVGDGMVFTASGWSGRESTKAFRLGQTGNLKEDNLVWEQKKGMPRVPSFVYLSPYLFWVNDGGIAMCVDGRNGDIVWQERLGGNYSASPVATDELIYFLSDAGETVIVRAHPEFEVVARNPLDEKCQASMAVARGRLFIRTETHVYCLGSHN
jgi:outer membrane protein assembly factor BamB